MQRGQHRHRSGEHRQRPGPQGLSVEGGQQIQGAGRDQRHIQHHEPIFQVEIIVRGEQMLREEELIPQGDHQAAQGQRQILPVLLNGGAEQEIEHQKQKAAAEQQRIQGQTPLVFVDVLGRGDLGRLDEAAGV